MIDNATVTRPPSPAVERLMSVQRALDGISHTWLALPLRFAVATVFWNSAMAKLANWDTTLSLFTDEYQLPVIPPEIAAYMATAIELTHRSCLCSG
jgi:putative oxidoreductase